MLVFLHAEGYWAPYLYHEVKRNCQQGHNTLGIFPTMSSAQEEPFHQDEFENSHLDYTGLAWMTPNKALFQTFSLP